MEKRIALIGCGVWGQNILRELVTFGVNVDVFETDKSLKQKLLYLGAEQVYGGIPKPEIYEGVIIATPSSTHRLLIEELAPFGVPLFVEKPLTTSLNDALALESIDTTNVFLMHIWLYHPGIRLMGKIVQDRELGEVLGVRSTRANWTSPRKDTDSAWNLLPHDITIAAYILGRVPKPKAAIAECHNGTIRGITALLGDNPYAIFEVSNRYERKVREVRVHCETGVLVLEDEKTDHIKVVHGNASSSLQIEKRTFDTTPPLHLEIREFLDYIDGGPPPMCDFRKGVEVVKMIHELVERSKQKQS